MRELRVVLEPDGQWCAIQVVTDGVVEEIDRRAWLPRGRRASRRSRDS